MEVDAAGHVWPSGPSGILILSAKGEHLGSIVTGVPTANLNFAPDGTVTVFRHPCGRTNGMTLDQQGRLLLCQSGGNGGGRRVTRLETDGKETVLAESYGGKPFNAPNDICVDEHGRIYFTDPNFGPPADASQPVSGVYRIDAPGKVTLVVDNLQRPNGIVITPDHRTVYVSDRGTQKLHRYRTAVNGMVGSMPRRVTSTSGSSGIARRAPRIVLCEAPNIPTLPAPCRISSGVSST